MVSGEFDLAAVDPFDRALAAIDLGGVLHVTLDLSRLTFMDAIGLRAVFSLADACREHSVAFAVKRGPRAVQRVFELTRTDLLLPFEGM